MHLIRLAVIREVAGDYQHICLFTHTREWLANPVIARRTEMKIGCRCNSHRLSRCASKSCVSSCLGLFLPLLLLLLSNLPLRPLFLCVEDFGLLPRRFSEVFLLRVSVSPW